MRAVSASPISAARRPRRSASASWLRSEASSRSAFASASRLCPTATLSSTSAACSPAARVRRSVGVPWPARSRSSRARSSSRSIRPDGQVRSNVTAGMYLWESGVGIVPPETSSMHPPFRALPSLLLLTLLACGGGKSGGYGCGLTTITGQSLLLDEFNRPGTALSALPADVPGALPVRIALGPSFRAVAGRSDSGLIEGDLPARPVVGFGVLVVSAAGAAQGVLLYEGSPIHGAPPLGPAHAGGRNL